MDKRITVIGCGYVGLATAASLADRGCNVTGVDSDEMRCRDLYSGAYPERTEPMMAEIVEIGLKSGHLGFTSGLKSAMQEADFVFLCVGTPAREDGSTDMSQLHAAIDEMAPHLPRNCIVVNKTTCPPGTTRSLESRIKQLTDVPFHIAACPEFLQEGRVWEGLMAASRIVVGADNAEIAQKIMDVLPFNKNKLTMSLESAELTKQASNAMLALKISFANMIANICEQTHTRVDDVLLGVGLDPRIGRDFLQPGLGYGGSCLPKDIASLADMGKRLHLDVSLLKATQHVNDNRALHIMAKIITFLRFRGGGYDPSKLEDCTVAVLGLAFKHGVDDVRDSPGIWLAENLVEEGARVTGFDPIAGESARKYITDEMCVVDSIEYALAGADVAIITTADPMFASADWKKLTRLMTKTRLLVDARNALDEESIRGIGDVSYISIGRETWHGF